MRRNRANTSDKTQEKKPFFATTGEKNLTREIFLAVDPRSIWQDSLGQPVTQSSGTKNSASRSRTSHRRGLGEGDGDVGSCTRGAGIGCFSRAIVGLESRARSSWLSSVNAEMALPLLWLAEYRVRWIGQRWKIVKYNQHTHFTNTGG
jgi:hypothetical protein